MVELPETKNLDSFLGALGDALVTVDSNELWPLKLPQMTTYFDSIYGLELYDQLQRAKKEKPLAEIAQFFKMPARLRMILSGVDIPIGLKALKVASSNKALGEEESFGFINDLLKMLTILSPADPFCLKGGDQILDEKDVKRIINRGKWWPTAGVKAKTVLGWAVDFYNLAWVFYYAAWLPAGLQIHGPYKTKEGILLVRDHYDLAPGVIWNLASQIPVRSVRISLIFKKLTGKINFLNQPYFKETLPRELLKFKIEVDGKEVTDFDRFESVAGTIQKITKEQTDFVNGLSALDQVRKGAEISWYLKKDLAEFLSDDWRPPEAVEDSILKNKDKFIRQFREVPRHNKGYWIKLYDIRNNFLEN